MVGLYKRAAFALYYFKCMLDKSLGRTCQVLPRQS